MNPLVSQANSIATQMVMTQESKPNKPLTMGDLQAMTRANTAKEFLPSSFDRSIGATS